MYQNLIKSLLNLPYPNVCPGCHAFLFPSETVCDACAEKMLIEQDAYCHQCGKINCLCKNFTPAYDKAVVACRYDEVTVPAVIHLKMSQNINFAYFSARILAERLRHGSYYEMQKIHYVMPVPMHPAKQRKRGYNQAALIAKEVADLLTIPYRDDVLYKNKSAVEQHTLKSAEQRAANVKNFDIHHVSLENACILLCDDVLTTGSTMNRCSALLKQQGASFVIAAAASSTVPKEKNAEEELSS